MDGTSPMRLATIAAMTTAAARDPAMARLLSVELDQRGYDRRGDHDLFVLAESVGVSRERLDELALLDAARVAEHATVICNRCGDTGSYDRGDGRFIRCHDCNPEPVEEES